MREVVIVDAVRSPIGRRNGGLSTAHSAELLAQIQKGLIDRVGHRSRRDRPGGRRLRPAGRDAVGQRHQKRLAHRRVADRGGRHHGQHAVRISQQATNLAVALVAGGIVDVAMGCGVEVMSRVPMGSSTPRDPDVGRSITRKYWDHHEMTSQFEGAERIAEQWGLTREDLDAFGKLSQDRAARAWQEGRYDTQVLPVEVPDRRRAHEGHRSRRRDARDPSREARPAEAEHARPGATVPHRRDVVTDQRRRRRRAAHDPRGSRAVNLEPIARVVGSCLVGSDPALMLTGPMPATRKLLADAKLEIDDIDVFEVNEAFAAVVVAWRKEH